MLTDTFCNLKNCAAVKLIRAFIRSPWYLALIAFLMAIAELFHAELPVFYVYLVFMLLIFLFDEDLLGMVPLFTCHYLSISYANNPGKHAETMFSDPSRMAQLFIIILIYAVLFLARLLSLLLFSGKKRAPELTFGFLFLGIALVMAGAFSGGWGQKTALFGLVEFLSFSAIYFLFLFAIHWENVPEGYGLMHLMTVGVGVVAEIVGMYFMENAIAGSYVNRSALYTGWGIYNNVGAMMAMCIPAPFFFAVKRKEGWIFSLLGIVFYLALLLTQSRSSMLFGSVVFLASVVIVLVRSKGWERWKHLIAYGGFLLVIGVSALILRDRVELLFRALGDMGWNDSMRFDTYRACWNRFLEAPWFGSGFYRTPGTVLQVETGMWTTMDGAAETTGFMPPRAHNTLFQLLASGGVFLVLAYGAHRVETGVLFFRHPSTEKTFFFVSVSALLLTSMLDCHLFNFGPGLVYSVILLFTEGANRRKNLRSLPTLSDCIRRA